MGPVSEEMAPTLMLEFDVLVAAPLGLAPVHPTSKAVATDTAVTVHGNRVLALRSRMLPSPPRPLRARRCPAGTCCSLRGSAARGCLPPPVAALVSWGCTI